MAGTFEYLKLKLAPTILGVKPAVLLTLKDCHRDVAGDLYSFYKSNKQNIQNSLEVQTIEFKDCGNCAKVMFYKEDLLEDIVLEKWRNRYLSKYGYSDCKDIHEFLNNFKKRFNTESFPHEIGIFLGYPLKDVAGFVHCPKKCCKDVGKTPWKIFGNPIPSLKIINSHRLAVNRMINMLSDEVPSQLHHLFTNNIEEITI